MTEKEKQELRMLGLDPAKIAERVYSPDAKQWNPADYIGWSKQNDGVPQVYESKPELPGRAEVGASLSPQEQAAMKKMMMNKLMYDQGESMKITAQPMAFTPENKSYLKALGYEGANWSLSEDDRKLLDSAEAKAKAGQTLNGREQMLYKALIEE